MRNSSHYKDEGWQQVEVMGRTTERTPRLARNPEIIPAENPKNEDIKKKKKEKKSRSFLAAGDFF